MSKEREFEITYEYAEQRIRTVKAKSLEEAKAIVLRDAEAGDLDTDYTLDGHGVHITDAEEDEPIVFVAPKGDPPEEMPSEPQLKVRIYKTQLEVSRQSWAKVAKEHDWYTEPFPVQFWVYADGVIQDSVSFTGLKRDLFILVEDETESDIEGDVNEIRELRPDEVEIV
jgi:hypothetical protein